VTEHEECGNKAKAVVRAIERARGVRIDDARSNAG